MPSKIEWTDEVWNPTTGCTKIATGCAHCYAERIAKRFWGDREFGDVRLHPERLDVPRRWVRRRKIFVDSMSDLFHPAVPFEFIERVWDVMFDCPQHVFIILTKRPLRAREFQDYMEHHRNRKVEYPNVWFGTSVSTQQDVESDLYLPQMLEFPAGAHVLSVEPMVGKIVLQPTHLMLLDWVIIGSESGGDARPFEIDWARDLRNQCVRGGVPFFFKQGTIDGKLVKMPMLDGRTWAEFPELSQ